jgi:membrane protease subunit HflC
MNTKALLIIALLVSVFVAANAFFIVHQTQQAIVLEFGKPVKFRDGDKEVSYINTPGLKIKVPFIQEVVFFDNRILNFSATDKEVLDLEKKTLTVNAFAKYKIVEPLTFYEKVTNIRGINDRLDKIFEASLRDAIGGVLLSKLLTDNRDDVVSKILESVSTKATDFGIEVFDVRIVRADLPKENSEAIYQRMRADREKEAREHRAQGEEEAKKIRANADKEVVILRAEARKQAEILRGEGDAVATKVFANAFNRDPEFFNFYRSLQAYKQSIKSEDTQLILSPDSEFLQFFGDVNGNARRAR